MNAWRNGHLNDGKSDLLKIKDNDVNVMGREPINSRATGLSSAPRIHSLHTVSLLGLLGSRTGTKKRKEIFNNSAASA